MINISVESGLFRHNREKYVLNEGKPLDVVVGANRLRVDYHIGRDLTGSARPEEPWVNIILEKGSGGVRVNLIGDPIRDPNRTHDIVPSIPMNEVDSLSASYREIVIEERGFVGRIFGGRVIIQNPDAFPRILGVAPEELFGIQRVQMWGRSHR